MDASIHLIHPSMHRPQRDLGEDHVATVLMFPTVQVERRDVEIFRASSRRTPRGLNTRSSHWSGHHECAVYTSTDPEPPSAA